MEDRAIIKKNKRNPGVSVPVVFSSSSAPLSLIDPQFNSPEYSILPGFCDVHVHFREPGFSYKETIRTGSLAAAHGGYTAVCTMPNLAPVPDDLKHLKKQTDKIEEDATVNVYPYGAITYGETGEELSCAMDDMAESDEDRTGAPHSSGRGLRSPAVPHRSEYRFSTESPPVQRASARRRTFG